MITFIAQLSLIIAVPAAVAVVWQRRTGAAWRTLLFALLAFAVYNIARRPVGDQVTPYFNLLADKEVWGIPSVVLGIPTLFIPQYFFFGLFREGVRWLTFRYAAKSVQCWRDGVLFGIGYTLLATVLMIWRLFSDQTGVPELDPPFFVARAMMLKDDFNWTRAIFHAWQYGVVTMIFNVGTSLAVLYSVRRRQVWLLPAAALLHILTRAAFFVALHHVPPVQLLSPWRVYFPTFWGEFVAFIAVLPALWLIFYLRKPLDRLAGNGNEPAS